MKTYRAVPLGTLESHHSPKLSTSRTTKPCLSQRPKVGSATRRGLPSLLASLKDKDTQTALSFRAPACLPRLLTCLEHQWRMLWGHCCLGHSVVFTRLPFRQHHARVAFPSMLENKDHGCRGDMEDPGCPPYSFLFSLNVLLPP